MNAVRKISVALTDELADDVERAVANGDYASTGEVVRDALRGWSDARATREAKQVELCRLVQEGLDSGPALSGGFDVDDIVRRGKERMRAKRG